MTPFHVTCVNMLMIRTMLNTNNGLFTISHMVLLTLIVSHPYGFVVFKV